MRPEVTRLESDGVRWELQPGFAPLLPGVLASAARVIKESPQKLVTVHEHDGRRWFIKRYRHSAVPVRPLKFFLKPSQARQEWQLATELEALRIPTVSHVALGERWGFGLQESILITEGFEGVTLEEAPGADVRAILAFVERLHERGVLQEDLHSGNILISTAGEMRLVDLHGTKVLAALTPEQRRRNLARLRLSLPLPVPADVAQLSEEMRLDFLEERSRRCLRHNRDFAPRKAGDLNWQVRTALLTSATEAVLNDPDGWLVRLPKLIKDGRTSTVGLADGLVLKRFNFRKLINLGKDLLRPSRARRAFRKAYHLELAGIPTPRCLAAADRRAFGFLMRSYLLMEEIPGAMDLKAYLRRGVAPEPAVIRAAAELLARLHHEGFSHRDLKESNLVLDARGKLYLIDLDGMDYLGRVSDAQAEEDLERLALGVAAFPHVTRTHRELFLRTYWRTRRVRPM
jgi:tRNA A-37 threonylcarbamoyl transferase component Bud32